MIGNDERGFRGKAATLAALTIAIAVDNLPWFFVSASSGIEPLLSCFLVSLTLTAAIPFVLARIAPKAAGFDRQFFPSAWSQWAWFAVMVVVVVAGKACAVRLTHFAGLGRTPFPVVQGHLIATKTIVVDLLAISLAPVAEEIFWRGYVLEQLRKLAPSVVALLLQSFLFSLAHFLLLGIVNAAAALWVGIILGVWRIKFRSLLPLILAHIVLNAVAVSPELKVLYLFTPILNKPKVQQINALALEPAPKAVPLLIGFLSDADQDVKNCATFILLRYFRSEAEPYLKAALASGDHDTLDGVLFIIETGHYYALNHEVRGVVWSVRDARLQWSAVATLELLDDCEGLRKIAESHPNGKTRAVAKQMIKSLEGKKGQRVKTDIPVTQYQY